MSVKKFGSARVAHVSIGSVVLGALLAGTSASPASAQPEMPSPLARPVLTSLLAAPTPQALAEDEALAEALAITFASIENLPPEVHHLPLNDPAVQQVLLANTLAATARVGIASSSFLCMIAIARFVGEIAIPAGKVVRIIKEAGGFRRFAGILVYFLRHRSFPPNASAELAELLVSLSGVSDVASACT